MGSGNIEGVKMDVIADGFNVIKTHKKVGKDSCRIKPVSKLLTNVVQILKDKGYIQSYELIDNGKGGELIIKGIGAINDCGAIKPRFAVGAKDWIKWEERYILSKEFGHLIVSTSQGVMTNVEAREKGVGGKLIGYVY